MNTSSTSTGKPRTIVVTGGASGIGHGIAEHFTATGEQVIIADIAGNAAEVATTIGARHIVCDVSEENSVTSTVSTLVEDYGHIDVLINNAGLPAGGGPLTGLPVDTLDTCTRVNLRGTFLMTKAVGTHMTDKAVPGVIVNVSSIGARQPTPGLGHYEATKAAVDALTRSAAIELAGGGIRVNAVAPGPVITPMTAGLVEDEEARAAWQARIPLGDIASVTDVAEAAAFLASPAARHITGVTLPVDGGQLLT